MQRSTNKKTPACSPPLLSNPEEFPQLAKKTKDTKIKDPYKRFLTVRHQDPNVKLSFINPWDVDRKLLAVVGKKNLCNISTDIGRLRSGVLLIEVHQKELCNRLLTVKKLGDDIKVNVQEHEQLNTSKGMVYCDAIKDMSVDDIKKEMESQDVIDVYRIQKRDGNRHTPTDLYVLTFGKPTLPSEVKIGYIKCDVRTYVPNPRRCFKCQQYGHGKNNCTHETVCVTCGQAGHEYGDQVCSEEPKCYHCEQPHESSSKKCAMYQLEKLILTEKCTHNLPIKTARSIVFNNNPKLVSQVPKFRKSKEQKTYSNVAANNSVNEELRLQNEQLQIQNIQLHHKMELLTNQLSSLLTALSKKQTSMPIPVPDDVISDSNESTITDSQNLPDIQPVKSKRTISISSQEENTEPSTKVRASSEGQEEINMPAPDSCNGNQETSSSSGKSTSEGATGGEESMDVSGGVTTPASRIPVPTTAATSAAAPSDTPGHGVKGGDEAGSSNPGKDSKSAVSNKPKQHQNKPYMRITYQNQNKAKKK